MATAALDEAAKARARSAAAAAGVQAAEADIGATEARIAVIDQLRATQRARLAAKQGPTIRLVAALQALSRRPAALALVQPGSVSDMVHVRAVLSAMLPVIEARTADVRADVARGEALRREADSALTSLKQGQSRLVEQRNRLAARSRERRVAADRLSGSVIAEQDRALALGEEARDITDLIGKIDAAAETRSELAALAGPVLRPANPGAARALPTLSNGADAPQAQYRMPVVGRIVAGLGEVSETGVRARGLTIATQPAAQVVAPTGGRVAFAAAYRGFKNIVIIDHGRGWTTTITNLAALDVKVGDTVDPGSPIGRADVARPMITVELRRNGVPVDVARVVS